MVLSVAVLFLFDKTLQIPVCKPCLKNTSDFHRNKWDKQEYFLRVNRFSVKHEFLVGEFL